MSHTISRRVFASVLAVAATLCVDRGFAQPTNTWIGTTTPANWSTAANWDVAPPASGSASTILQFNNFGSLAPTWTQDLSNPFTLNGLILNSSSTGTTTITNAAANTSSLSITSGPFVLQNNSGAVTISGNTTTTGTVTFTSSAIFGGGGTGAVTISAPVVFQGVGFAVNGYNTTTFSNSTAGGSIALQSGGLAIIGNGIGNVAFTGIITGTSTPVSVNTGSTNFDSGFVQLSGLNTFTGGVNLQSGVLAIGGTGTATTGALGNGGTLTISGGLLRTSAAATVFNTISMNNADMLFAGTTGLTMNGPVNVTGTSGLQILGTGGPTIQNAAHFNGATTIGIPGLISGTLTIGSSATTTGTLLNTTGITVNTAAASATPGNLIVTDATAAVASRLSVSTPITLNNGRITYVAGTGTNAESFGNIIVNGFGGIGATAAGTATTLTFGTLTRNGNATVAFRGNLAGTAGFVGTSTTGDVVNSFANGPFTGLAPPSSGALPIIPWAVGFFTPAPSGSTPPNFSPGNISNGNTATINTLVIPDGNGIQVLNSNTQSAAGLVTTQFNIVNSGGFATDQNNLFPTTNTGSPTAIPANTALRVNSLLMNGSQSPNVGGGQGSVLQIYSGVIMMSASANFTVPVIDFGANTAYFYQSGKAIVSSSITGSGGVVVSGTEITPAGGNAFVLDAPNFFTGGLTLNGSSRTDFVSDAALGAPGSAITFAGGSLQYFGGGVSSFSRPIVLTALGGALIPTAGNGDAGQIAMDSSMISGNGPLTVIGPGTVSLSGTTPGAWSTVVNSSGILQFTGDSNFGSGAIILNGGTFQPTTSNTLTRSLQINASSTIDVGSQNLTFAGAISTLGYTATAGSPPTLTKAGLGNLTLTANSPFVGPVTVSAGTLTLSGANGRLANATLATVAAGAALVLDNTAANNNDRYSGPVTLTGGSFSLLGNTAGTTESIGALTASGFGSTVTLTAGAGASTQLTAANLTVTSGGTLVIRGPGLGTTGPNSSQLLASTAPVLSGGIIAGAVGDNDPINGGGSYLVTYNSSNGVTAAALTNSGGTITASTANILANLTPTTVPASAAVNSLTLAPGTTLTGGGNTVTLATGMLVSQSGAGSTIDNTTTIASGSGTALTLVTPGNLTVNGTLTSATNSVVKLGAGTLTLGGSPTFTGTITVSAGVVEVPASTTTTIGGIAGNGTVNVDGAIALTGSGTFFGTLSGPGSVSRSATASGTQVLGPVTLTGGLESDSGTLTLQGNVAAAATPIIIGGNGSTNSATLTVAPGVTINRDIDFQAGTGASRTLSSTATVANQAPVTFTGTVTVDSLVTLSIPQNGSVYNVSGTGQIAGPGIIFVGNGFGGGGTLNLFNANSGFAGVIKLESQTGTGAVFNTVLGIGSSSSLGTGSLVIQGTGSSILSGGGYLQAFNAGLTLSNGITVSNSGGGGAVLGLLGTNSLTLSTVDVTNQLLTIDNHSSNGSVFTISTLSGDASGGVADITVGFPLAQTGNVIFPIMPAANVVQIGTLSTGGATTVTEGVLQITGTATAQDASGNFAKQITVTKFGTLAGTGTINRNVEIAGTIAPGTGGASGTLTFNNPMSWDSGGKFALSYSSVSNASAGVNYNTISSTSTLDLTGLTATNPFTIVATPVGNVGTTIGVTFVLGTFSSGAPTGGITGFNSADFVVSGSNLPGTPIVGVDANSNSLLLTFANAPVGTGAVSGLWSNSGNWSPATVPTSSPNTALVFSASPNPAMTNDLPGIFTLNAMVFTAGAPAYTLGGNGLNFQTNSGGSLPQIVQDSANAITINNALTLTNNLIVSGTGNLALNGVIGGTAGLTYSGTGTLTLGNAANNYSGGTSVLNGVIQVAADGALGAGNVTGSSLGTLSYTASNATTRSFNMNGGTITIPSGQTLTFNGSQVAGGYLDGAGTFATNAANGAQFVNMTSTQSVAVSSNSSADRFNHFSNGGLLNVAANLNFGAATTFNGVVNQGSGTISIGANSLLNASNFQSYGEIDLAPGSRSTGSSGVTQIKNVGSAPLDFNGGSRTFIATVATASTYSAGFDLNGQNAVVSDGLFVNNGYVIDSSNGGFGTNTVIADFGALVKGAGFFQNSPITRNGGRVQAGNSPGAASFGQFVFGPGGVSNYVFAIDNATGVAGPTADANGQVSGWGLLKAVRQAIGSATTGGNFVWTANANNKLTVSLETLVNPTTAGTDPNGLMANFDPTKSYSWPAVEWSGVYTGPTTVAALDAATTFDTSEFANPVAGSFGWSLDPAAQTLSLTYTPSAVPEPGTLALTGLAGLSFGWVARRRRARRGEAAAAENKK